MELPLRVVLDEGFTSPEPEPLVVPAPVQFRARSWGRSWQLDAIVAASVSRPVSLTLVTGIRGVMPYEGPGHPSRP